jgi:hypothetical protein
MVKRYNVQVGLEPFEINLVERSDGECVLFTDHEETVKAIAEKVRERLASLCWQSVYSEMQSPRAMNVAECVEAIRTADLSDIKG